MLKINKTSLVKKKGIYVCGAVKVLCEREHEAGIKDLNNSWRLMTLSLVAGRVHLTVGNRSGLTGYRSGPVSVWVGIKPAQIQNSNLNLKK